MDFLKEMNEDGSEFPFDVKDIQRCPFLRNINKPTNLSFSSSRINIPMPGAKGPIFEDGPNFDSAFKLFHGKDGIIPLSEKSALHNDSRKLEPQPVFNPLAAKFASISLSSFGPGRMFGFGNFSDKWKKQKKTEPSNKREPSSQGTVVSAIRPPPEMKLRCPPAVVAARAALARTAFVKNLRLQPLPAKMLATAALAMAVNVPLGVWKEHTKKFSLSWFAAVHAAVPFIAMLRKSVFMPKSAMALTIAASILGQVLGSRAERMRLKAISESGKVVTETASTISSYNPSKHGNYKNGHCGAGGMAVDSVSMKGGSSNFSSQCLLLSY